MDIMITSSVAVSIQAVSPLLAGSVQVLPRVPLVQLPELPQQQELLQLPSLRGRQPPLQRTRELPGRTTWPAA